MRRLTEKAVRTTPTVWPQKALELRYPMRLKSLERACRNLRQTFGRRVEVRPGDGVVEFWLHEREVEPK